MKYKKRKKNRVTVNLNDELFNELQGNTSYRCDFIRNAVRSELLGQSSERTKPLMEGRKTKRITVRITGGMYDSIRQKQSNGISGYIRDSIQNAL